MSEWQGTKERTAQAFRQEPLWDLLGVQPGREFRADLHAHTTLSDGSDSFLELMGNIGRCRAALTIISVEMPANGLKRSVTSWNCWKMMERQKEKKHFSV